MTSEVQKIDQEDGEIDLICFSVKSIISCQNIKNFMIDGYNKDTDN